MLTGYHGDRLLKNNFFYLMFHFCLIILDRLIINMAKLREKELVTSVKHHKKKKLKQSNDKKVILIC